jgi:hypothetical protein
MSIQDIKNQLNAVIADVETLSIRLMGDRNLAGDISGALMMIGLNDNNRSMEMRSALIMIVNTIEDLEQAMSDNSAIHTELVQYVNRI